ncbi:hypothetical protein [Neisseria sicca]|uniref:hypothetical protein n=1 Tax=Neisseria sicca TaxID=490 RepID=UPI001649BA6E|nr:hypothetical protein [Neisseria sicca]
MGRFQGCRNFKFLDSRLRGNDGGRREFQATSPQKYSGLTLNQYDVTSPCRTICTVCGFVALS